MFIWSPRRGVFKNHVKVDLKRCRVSVSDRQCFTSFYQCCRKATVFREISDEKLGFCTQHDPEQVKKRQKTQTERARAVTNARIRPYEIARCYKDALVAIGKAKTLARTRELAARALRQFSD